MTVYSQCCECGKLHFGPRIMNRCERCGSEVVRIRNPYAQKDCPFCDGTGQAWGIDCVCLSQQEESNEVSFLRAQ